MHISAQLSFVKLCTRSFIQIYHLFVQHFFFFECAHAYGRFHLDEAIFVLNYKSRFSNIYTKKFCAQHTASTFYATLYRQQQAAITPAMTVSREKKKIIKYIFSFSYGGDHSASVEYWFECYLLTALLQLRNWPNSSLVFFFSSPFHNNRKRIINTNIRYKNLSIRCGQHFSHFHLKFGAIRIMKKKRIIFFSQWNTNLTDINLKCHERNRRGFDSYFCITMSVGSTTQAHTDPIVWVQHSIKIDRLHLVCVTILQMCCWRLSTVAHKSFLMIRMRNLYLIEIKLQTLACLHLQSPPNSFHTCRRRTLNK